jgi:hypothetical protein
VESVGTPSVDAQLQIDFGGCAQLHGARILRK